MASFIMRVVGGRWLRSVVAALVVLALAGGSALAAGKPAPHAGVEVAAKRSAVAVGVVSRRQRNVLRLRYLRVRVRVRRAASLRLFVTASRKPGRRRAYTVTRRRLLLMSHPGSKVVRLRLNKAGRRLLAGCRSTIHIRPSGRVRRQGAHGGRRLRASRRRLLLDTRRCGAGANKYPPLGRVRSENADRCDFLDPALCLYPWPNDHFSRSDPSTPTRRRLNLNVKSMPTNRYGTPIDPTDQNRGDGFSPGNLIAARVPGLDSAAAFKRTGAVPITDMARSFDHAQPVVVINARTRQRQLIWSEIDSNPANPHDVSLIVRPGKNFQEGERYIVALRGMRNASGSVIAPREEFRAYRDQLKTQDPDIERRRAHFESLFDTLRAAGIGRRDLYLTWDFTVASTKSLADRALSIRNDAFAQLGDTNLADLQVQGATPQFIQNPDINDDLADGLGSIDTDPVPNPIDFANVDGRRDYPPCSAGTSAACEEGESDRTARRVAGQLVVPCYLDAAGCPPGSSFNLGADGRPQRIPGNTALANVICTIPRAAVDGAGTPGASRASLYGHGLLGSASEVDAGNVQSMGQEHNFVFCATDWAGMSTYDLPNVALLLQDLSTFRTLVDRIQQGYVSFMYLGRWMLHPGGASANAAFRVGGQSVIDTRRLFYDGNSQGGILSGGLTALAPDFQRAVQGVPGMNYSTLLRRSVDFDMYAKGDIEGQHLPIGLYQNYPKELERPLILSLIQLLWDRGESDGYAQHMTTAPYPDTPAHQVLLHPSFGDHQVSNVTAEAEARTIGACAYRPAVFPGRSLDVTPLFGIPSFGSPSCTGSGIVYWDSGPLRTVNGQSKGTPPAPTTNTPPRAGNDPHSAPRNDPKARQQKSDFLKLNGSLINACGPGPCYDDGFTGP